MCSDAEIVAVVVAGVIIDDLGGFFGGGRRTRVGVLVDVDKAIVFAMEVDVSITVTFGLFAQCKLHFPSLSRSL